MSMARHRYFVYAASIVLLCLLAFAPFGHAGQPDVLKAVASQQGSPGDNNFRFDVTIRSADIGWDYYCDRFEIVAPDGRVLGTRVLYHPHDTEQPFTRSLSDVKIDKAVKSVEVRAFIKPTNEGGDTVKVELPGR